MYLILTVIIRLFHAPVKPLVPLCAFFSILCRRFSCVLLKNHRKIIRRRKPQCKSRFSHIFPLLQKPLRLLNLAVINIITRRRSDFSLKARFKPWQRHSAMCRYLFQGKRLRQMRLNVSDGRLNCLRLVCSRSASQHHHAIETAYR